MEYVPPEAFGEDYLYFYDAFLTDEVSDAQTDPSGGCSGSRRASRCLMCREGTAESRTGSPPEGRP